MKGTLIFFLQNIGRPKNQKHQKHREMIQSLSSLGLAGFVHRQPSLLGVMIPDGPIDTFFNGPNAAEFGIPQISTISD